MYHETRSVFSDIHLPESNNLVSPRPITDLGVRKALGNDDSLAKLKVPPKDEKILALITEKGEQERRHRKKRLKRQMAWDKERIDSDRLRLEKDMNHRAKVEIIREEDRQMVQIKKLEKQKKRLKRKVELLTELENTNKQAEKRIRSQRKLRDKKIQAVSLWESENKTRQEKNWWHHNSAEYKQKLKEKIEHDKKRLQAWEKRDERMKELHERLVKENEEERKYFTKRYVIYEKKLKSNKKELVERIEHRLSTTQENYEKHVKDRLKDIQTDAKKEDKKLQHALKLQQKLEKDHHIRMMKMLQKTQEGIDKASENISKAFEKLTDHIKQERKEKEKDQKKNMKTLQKASQKWTKKISKEIESREDKMKAKQEERQKVMERTRSVANDSRILRNKLLDRYGAENFDRKLLRVESFRCLGTRPSTQDWNTSSISLL